MLEVQKRAKVGWKRVGQGIFGSKKLIVANLAVLGIICTFDVLVPSRPLSGPVPAGTRAVLLEGRESVFFLFLKERPTSGPKADQGRSGA